MDPIEQLEKYQSDAIAAIAAAVDSEGLEQVRRIQDSAPSAIDFGLLRSSLTGLPRHGSCIFVWSEHEVRKSTITWQQVVCESLTQVKLQAACIRTKLIWLPGYFF